MMEHIPEGHALVLVAVKPDPAPISFGMADLLKSRHLALDHWHRRDEVPVWVGKPLPLLSVEIVTGRTDEAREVSLWERAGGGLPQSE